MSDDTTAKKPTHTYGAAALGGLLAERESDQQGNRTIAEQLAAMTPEARAVFWRSRGVASAGPRDPDTGAIKWSGIPFPCATERPPPGTYRSVKSGDRG